MRLVHRRTLLAGAGAAALGLLAACSAPPPGPSRVAPPQPTPSTVRSGSPLPGTPPGPAVAGTHRLHSAARGRDVDLITVLPGGLTGAELAALPVCLALHGRGDSAASFTASTRLAAVLTAAIAAGAPPFAFAVPDGGPLYWMAVQPGDDPQAMLTAEVPGWLTSIGLTRDGGVPRGALGISMGCFSALYYARTRPAPPPAAVATISPALFTSWPDAGGRHVFGTESQWQADEPLLHLPELPSATALGVWCGTGDPFYPAARRLVAGAHPAVAAFAPGAHTLAYWQSVLPAAVGWLAPELH